MRTSKLPQALAFLLPLFGGVAHAQQVFTQDVQITSQNAAVPNLKTTGSGGVVFGGVHGTGSIPAVGDGSRLMWYPGKSAFRAGYTSNGLWDDNNIGEHSIALGGNSKASGFGAVALGSAAATGHQSFAAGWGSTATSDFAVAMGIGTASGPFSFAASGGTASGWQSIAFSGHSYGNYAVALTYYATAVAIHSTVVGQFNKLDGDPLWPQLNDPIFIVGTGTGENDRKNGFEVRRDGTIRMAKRQGDIVMGEFGNGNGD
jgi:hypothetical protein